MSSNGKMNVTKMLWIMYEDDPRLCCFADTILVIAVDAASSQKKTDVPYNGEMPSNLRSTFDIQDKLRERRLFVTKVFFINSI